MIDAMKQAMYLIEAWERGAYAEEYPNEIAALRQALAQPDNTSDSAARSADSAESFCKQELHNLMSVAGRMALELECLLLDTENLSVVSKWWDTGMEALQAYRHYVWSVTHGKDGENFCDTHCVHTDHHPDCELAQPKQEPVAWTQVSDALPKSGVPVLACYKNRLGNLRRIRACWVAAKTEEASLDYGECYEYDEETDEYYLPEGWYECMDNWHEYSSVAVCEGEVTHWIPLPLAPDEECTAPPSKPWVSLTDEEIPTFDYATPQFLAEKKFARAIEAALRSKNT